MEALLHEFIGVLRSHGVRISISETLDAMNAVRLLGVQDRETFEEALSATLAKSLRDKELFALCFERFFRDIPVPPPHPDGLETKTPGPDDGESPLSRLILSGNGSALSAAIRRAAEDQGIDTMRFFTQKGRFIQRILEGMGADQMDRDIRRLSREEDSSSQRRADALGKAKDRLLEAVKGFVEHRYALFARSSMEEIMENALRNTPLSSLEKRDFERMHQIVGRMVKRLEDRHSRRKRAAKKGKLDLKGTLRDNLRHQGVLFKPKWRSKRMDRPEIVALCDISRSVQAVARFMLLFLYSLNQAVARVRSFVFCSNLREASRIFDEYPVDEAVEKLQDGSCLGVQLGRTDYGQAFRDFKENWMHTLSKTSTVLILGDGRNNRGNPETGIVRLIRDRSKRLIWLNPEPRQFWGVGDSEMHRYLPYCFLARECSTVNHLERVVDLLLKTRR